MKKNFYILAAIALFALAGVIACSNSEQHVLPPGPPPSTTEVVTYEEDQDNFCNPERGFYTYRQFLPSENTTLTPEYVKEYREKGITLIFMTHTMKEFRDKPISDAYLNRIRTNMQALRDGGSKTVLRFCYTDDTHDEPWDAPWNIMENHIQQLAPIFSEYVDVISVLEAGFVGVWGEWYYTTHYVMNPKDDQYGPRKQVIEALLKALPKERMIALRTPKAKVGSYGITYADSITINNAYDGSDLSRLAAHNDCVFADANDSGTFTGKADRMYWEKESKYYVMGGESCSKSTYSACDKALVTLKNYHWSYLNIDYHDNVIDDWKDSGCFETIQKQLGYRFVLKQGEFGKEAEVAKPYKMQLSLVNVGWAAPYNPRNVEIVFVSTTDASKQYVIRLKEDPRHWFSNKDITLDLSLTLPSDITPGNYNICLNLPDPQEVLSQKSEFSIRLANKKVWEEATGYNKLYQVQVVKK